MTNKERIMKVLSKDGFFYALYYGLKLTHLDRFISDKNFVRLQYRCYTGLKLDLKNPKTYNEKLLWIKIYEHNDKYTDLVDKYKVKDFVKDTIGEEYIIPTIGVWDKPEEIDFNSLPNQFVLKTNHSGNNEGIIICKDKKTLDKSKAIKKLRKSLNTNMYLAGREWPYKNVQKRVIAETYMEDSTTHDLRDYKFFCFDGEVKALFVATDRQGEDGIVKFDFFDKDFNHLEMTNVHPTSSVPIAKPNTFEIMKQCASKLSKGLPQCRVDLYEVNGKVYFGEITLFHNNGTQLFQPDKWNYIFGEWIDLTQTEFFKKSVKHRL